jgi:hypothetical protein
MLVQDESHRTVRGVEGGRDGCAEHAHEQLAPAHGERFIAGRQALGASRDKTHHGYVPQVGRRGVVVHVDQDLAKVLPVTESQEPYVLEDHVFRQEDGTFLRHERYADEAAIYRHMQVTAEGQADRAAATDLLDLVAAGELGQGFRDAFDSPVVSRYRRFREASRPYTAA